MAIGADKTQLLLTLEKSDKEKLEALASDQCRTLTSLINFTVKEYIKENAPQPTITISEPLYNKLKEYSDSNSLSINEAVEKIITDGLKKPSKAKPRTKK